MTDQAYNVIKPETGAPIKTWTKGVPLEDAAQQQLLNVAQLPFIYKWVAAMPDVHWGIGATVGSVIPRCVCEGVRFQGCREVGSRWFVHSTLGLPCFFGQHEQPSHD
jgi:hypothetical protein